MVWIIKIINDFLIKQRKEKEKKALYHGVNPRGARLKESLLSIHIHMDLLLEYTRVSLLLLIMCM